MQHPPSTSADKAAPATAPVVAEQLSSRAKAQLWLDQAAQLEAAQEEGASEEEEGGEGSFTAAHAPSHGYQDLRHRPRHTRGEVR